MMKKQNLEKLSIEISLEAIIKINLEKNNISNETIFIVCVWSVIIIN